MHAVQIHLHGFLPGVFISDGGRQADHGAVDDNVETAKSFRKVGDCPTHLGIVRDVDKSTRHIDRLRQGRH